MQPDMKAGGGKASKVSLHHLAHAQNTFAQVHLIHHKVNSNQAVNKCYHS
jgi:hypothetical protein